ncbi:hypothetical protein ARALYDRAFT_484349 [Arabidopsis lyrata subsp. lyrata]|uniref:DC1 domain-containing protein n=1 Tax=Arabidopsis lyrata subsp. lyrata TaxID=81972 RepID=D7LQV6_ARALL|nr:hypothetical protein ARALYDRAFT_484349 [Arabidopsis lyrata subsp. lyrata]
MTEKKFPFHDHPLSYEKLDKFSCIFATFGVIRNASSAHFCIHLLANILSRSTHEALGYGGDHCHFCRDYLLDDFFHCLIYNINMDLKCLKDPPPSSIYYPKNHMHMLTLLARVVTFTCNACASIAMIIAFLALLDFSSCCSHGAFTCPRCPSIAFHLKCAMKDGVWDGKEFEAEPEKELEDETEEELEDDSEEEIEGDTEEEIEEQ